MVGKLQDACIHQLFEFQADRTPDAIAIDFAGRQLTYQSLNCQANRLAHQLQRIGVGPEVLVAICVERSLEMVIGLLAILKAGGAYVPLDPSYPKSRLAFMLDHSQAPVLLTQRHLIDSLPEHQARVICLDANLNPNPIHCEENPRSGVTSNQLAYVIYTSGSTGQPKGVAIAHRGAVNTILDINYRFSIGPGDRGLALSSLSFDLSVYDIFGLLIAGGTVVIPQPSATPDPSQWLELMTESQVTVWNSAPALMQMLVDRATTHHQTLPASLRLVLLSGDWIPLTLPERIRDLTASASDSATTPTVISLGGATEASIWSILYAIGDIDPNWKSIPYGRPLTNQQIYVLNETLEPCQGEEVGQLYIGGLGLARGYWRDEEKTQQRFITHPLTGNRLYCTGDLGRYLPDGNIEFLGRIDHQVKIRGFRVELGEIETVLGQHPDVQVAVVATQSQTAGQQRLVAYIVSQFTIDRTPFKSEAIAEWQGGSAKVQIEDISPTGIGLANVPPTWSTGQSIRLHLVLPEESQESCLEGCVAWCQGQQAGIQLSLTPTQQTILQQSLSNFWETQGFFKLLQRSTAGKLRTFLRDRLPDYMVPSSFVFLKTLPLTPNGKIDRQQLLTLSTATTDLDSEFVAPRTPIEETLVRIWAEVLGLERVGIRNNFFELGGHSLLGVQVVGRIRDAFQIELPIRTLFESPTVAELAGSIERMQRDASGLAIPALEPASRTSIVPLSPAQEQLWFLCQLNPNVPVYNEPFTLHLPHPLNLGALERSLKELIRRHETLRSTFSLVEGQPVMAIQDDPQFTLPIVNLAGLPKTEREAEALRLATWEAQQPFDLTFGPLLRATVVQLDETDNRLFLTLHHLIMDGVSLYSVFLQELITLYTAFATGLPSPLPDLKIQFADFVRWQRQWLQLSAIDTQLAYWKRQLADLPVLQLPTDRPRSHVQTFQGTQQCLVIPQSLTEDLKELSRQQNVTLFMTLIAAFQTLLYRLTGQTDIPVGTVTGLRDRQELEGTIGYLLNTLVIRTHLAGNLSFKDLLGRVREVTLEAYTHRDVPFSKVVEAIQPERNLGHHPLFQVAFSLQPPLPEMSAGWSISQLDVDTGTAKFDLYLELDERSVGIIGRLQYNTNLFDAATIHRILGHWQTLLAGIVANPDQNLLELPLLTELEQQQLLGVHSDWMQRQDSNRGCIQQLFETQVERSPQAVALVFEDRQLTYQELNHRANQVAHHLRKRGIGSEAIVGIYMERSLEMVIGLLGILKAGAAYLPLDPGYPSDRIAFMLEDACVPLVLTQEKLMPMLLEQGVPLVCLDTGWKAIARLSEENPVLSVQPHHLAYVIYTSGSTGLPKGVLLEHQGLCNLATAQSRIFGIQSTSRVLQFASFCFDASVSEIFMTLVAGATLVLATQDALLPGVNLLALLRTQAITTVTLPPSVLAVLPPSDLPELQTLILAGEAFSLDLVARWTAGRRVFNAYGPTEVTVCATVAEVTGKDRKLSIGRAIANTHALILDDRLQPVPVGIPGEIYLGGIGLARGYLNQPEITTERFIPNPFQTQTQVEPAAAWRLSALDRLYRTGDRGRYLPDGAIEYLGRIDDQVKIRGFRIELGEIETVLAQHQGVRQAVVVSREDVPGDKRLVAYLIPEESDRPPLHQPASDRIELWPSVAEYFVYDELLYYAMTHDERRNQSYKVAIHQLVKDKVVVEVGTGKDAILARFCVEAGAKKVYAIERSEESYKLAKACIQNLGWENQIVLIHGDATQVNLPEPADICLSEIVGAIGGCEGAAVILNNVRRFLKDDGVMIPQKSVTKIAAVCLPDELLENPQFNEVPGYYTDQIFKQVGYPFDLRLSIKKFPQSHLISNSDIFEDLDFNRPLALEYQTAINLTISKDSRLDGFLVWLTLQTIEGEVIDIIEHEYCWLPVYFPVFHPGLPVSAGDRIQAVCRGTLCENNLNPDYEIEGFVFKQDGRLIEFKYKSYHHKEVFKHNAFYERLWSRNRTGLADISFKDYLKQRLPDYMIPTSFVTLKEFPKTPNGKIDRKALPVPDDLNLSGQTNFVAPKTDLERKIAQVWQQVLHLEKVGVDDNFFDLGGHSLLMAQAQSQLREEIDREVSMIELFKYPTVSSLAQYLSQEIGESFTLERSYDRAKKQKAAMNRQRQRQGL